MKVQGIDCGHIPRRSLFIDVIFDEQAKYEPTKCGNVESLVESFVELDMADVDAAADQNAAKPRANTEPTQDHKAHHKSNWKKNSPSSTMGKMKSKDGA
jgi:hypothetical protein